MACGTVSDIYVVWMSDVVESLDSLCPKCSSFMRWSNVVPRSDDEGVEYFVVMVGEEVEAVLMAGEFTPVNGCVVSDFWVRREVLMYEWEKDYVQSVSGHHRLMPLSTI